MSDSIVVVRELNKTYDNGTEALKSISFEVNEGEIFGLIGVNGAGKTTLIRSLVTMLRPTSGSATVMGLDPVKEPERVRSLVGVLPQNAGLYEELTINENLEFIAEMQGVPQDSIKDRISEVAKILGIQDRLDTRVDHLSGGLKQRAMIARTLLGKPKLLFLDEPTTGLDVLVARKVRKTIKELSSEMTIFLATHNMFEAYQLCDRVAIIKQGEILLVDTPQNIMKNHRANDEDFEDIIAKLLGIDDLDISEVEMEVK